MATLIVATASPPFAEGGHLVMARELVRALQAAGHDASLVVTPQNRFGRQGSAYLAAWCTDVGVAHEGRRVDQVISLRYPAYAVRHDRHVVWLNHRMREYYDLWEHFTRGLGRKGRFKETVRRQVFHALDKRLLTRNVTRLVAQSRTIQERLRRFGNIPSELLYPPPPERPYRTEEYGDYILAVSRLTPLKRLGLLVESVPLMRDRFLAVKIAGDGEEADRLRARIADLGLAGRVEMLGAVSDEQLVEHYARCRGVYFAPWNEDYGFVTLESFRSAKAVVTAADSGGPAELVRHEHNGLVAQPTPQSMAEQLDRLADRDLAERLGRSAEVTAREHTWERAVKVLAYN